MRSLYRHIALFHKMPTKEYYDSYLKINNDEGICPICGKQTRFVSINKGYKKYCSGTCVFRAPEVKQLSKEHLIEKYGVDNARKSDIVKQKARQTFQQRYNANSSAQAKEIREKYIKTRKNNTLKKYNNILSDYNIICLNRTKYYFFLRCNTCHIDFKLSTAQFNRLIKKYHKIYCPECEKDKHFTGYSYKEKELLNYIKEIYDGEIIENAKNILKRKEIDIYLPTLKIGFEFDGSFWHADPRIFKSNDIIISNITAADIWEHDRKKDLECKALNITLIRIKEYDWINTNLTEKEKISRIIYESRTNC